MWKKYCIVGIVSFLLSFIITTYFYSRYENLTIVNLQNKIDSLNLHINSIKTIKDSLIYITKERHDTINTIQQIYEEKYNHLITLSPDSQCLFFSDYLSKTSKRFSCYNNNDTIRTDE